MNWKNWPSWLKGGVIGILIGGFIIPPITMFLAPIIAILYAILRHSPIISLIKIFAYLFGILTLPWSLILIWLFHPNDSNVFSITAISFWTGLIINGFIIGAIIGRIKEHKK